MDKTFRNMIIAGVVMLAAAGSLGVYTHRADAKNDVKRQALIEQQDIQKAQEAAIYNSKGDAPRVDESQPARYIEEKPATAATSSTQPDPDKANQTTPPTNPPKVPAPVASQELPVLTTTPPAQPKPEIVQESVPAITSLSEADIQRLQGYPTYGSSGKGSYRGFDDFYANERSNAEGFLKRFSPAALSVYNKAKVDWLSTPRLVYRSWTSQICIRGILTVTYYGDNSFGLTPNVTYQREVEYRLDNSVKNGAVSLTLDSIHYLSEFQAVK